MKYLFLLLPFLFIAASLYYRAKFVKFKDTGRIPEIMAAKQNTTLMFALGIISIFIFLAMIGLN
jgi:hypothetical protein